jgi:adenylosuccinate synthase
VASDGRHHTFAQFGSGTFSGAETYLGPGMMVNPLDMANEFAHLEELGEGDAWDRLAVHKSCLVTTPYHEAANHLRERLRGDEAHGSCGKGIGETRSFALIADSRPPREPRRQSGSFSRESWNHALRVGDLGNRVATRRKLEALIKHYSHEFDPWPFPALIEAKEALVGEYAEWADRTRIVAGGHLRSLLDRGPIVFEGSQGVLLDERYGFHPHTTWSNVTAEPALDELFQADVARNEVSVIGVTRTYSTRHGAGPFPAGHSRILESDFEEEHNEDDGHQGEFRKGPFDALMFQYAVRCSQPDAIAVTHLDKFALGFSAWPVVTSYSREVLEIDVYKEIPTQSENLFRCSPIVEYLDPARIVDKIEKIAGAPATILGYGPNDYRTLSRTAVR